MPTSRSAATEWFLAMRCCKQSSIEHRDDNTAQDSNNGIALE